MQSFLLNSLGKEYLAAQTLKLPDRRQAMQRGEHLFLFLIWVTHLGESGSGRHQF